MQAALGYRGFSGDEPSGAAGRAQVVGQFAAGGADFDLAQVGGAAVGGLAGVQALGPDGVDDAQEQGRRGVESDQRGVAVAIEVAQPDHQHVGAEGARGPRVAESPGSAGFPGHGRARRRQGVGADVAPQHVEYDEAGLLAQEARFRGRLGPGEQRERAPYPAVGQHGVKLSQFFHGHFAAAQHQRQAVVLLAFHARDAGHFQEIVQVGPVQLGRDRDGGHVSAADQGVLRGDGADEAAVEVLRAEGAERGGRVLEHGERMQDALVERQAVDEGLQGRTRRTLGLGSIHLAEDVRIEVIRRSHHGLDLHAGGVEQQGGGVVHAAVALRPQVFAHDALDHVLQAQVQAGADVAAGLAQQQIDGVRCLERQSRARRRLQCQLLVRGQAQIAGVALQPVAPQPQAGRAQGGVFAGGGQAAAGFSGITASARLCCKSSRAAGLWKWIRLAAPTPSTLLPKGTRLR